MLIDIADPETRAQCLDLELFILDRLAERLRTEARLKVERATDADDRGDA